MVALPSGHSPLLTSDIAVRVRHASALRTHELAYVFPSDPQTASKFAWHRIRHLAVSGIAKISIRRNYASGVNVAKDVLIQILLLCVCTAQKETKYPLLYGGTCKTKATSNRRMCLHRILRNSPANFIKAHHPHMKSKDWQENGNLKTARAEIAANNFETPLWIIVDSF